MFSNYQLFYGLIHLYDLIAVQHCQRLLLTMICINYLKNTMSTEIMGILERSTDAKGDGWMIANEE